MTLDVFQLKLKNKMPNLNPSSSQFGDQGCYSTFNEHIAWVKSELELDVFRVQSSIKRHQSSKLKTSFEKRDPNLKNHNV
jgi:hypothetical protein